MVGSEQGFNLSPLDLAKLGHVALFESMKVSHVPLRYYDVVAERCGLNTKNSPRDLYAFAKELVRTNKVSEVEGFPIELIEFLATLPPLLIPDTFDDLSKMELIAKGRDRATLTIMHPPAHIPAYIGQLLVGKEFKLCTVVAAPLVSVTHELRTFGINCSGNKCFIFDSKSFVETLMAKDYLAATKYAGHYRDWNVSGNLVYFGIDCAEVKVG